MNDFIIGIDLGTTTTEAAIFRNGKVEMIPSFDGEKAIPSAVGIDESGNFIVGQKAKAQFILSPERTAIEIKRKIGTSEQIRLGKKNYSAAELSAKILEYVKRYAEEYLGQPVNRAVISVPAYFDDIQRRETAEAGRMAGFVVERIINEPTAAALSYGIGHLQEKSHILVYDLGGGTFDVTVLEMFEGVMEVLASSGDNRLGGKDFDACLIQYLKDTFKEKTGVSLDGNVFAEARLKEAAEACKIALSTEERATVQLPMLADKGNTPMGLEETITREQFEQLIWGELERTRGPIEVALSDSKIAPQDLDMILLAGGSTRIPLVSKSIHKIFGKDPSEAIHPDYSIAEGAALQAAIISGEIDNDDSIILTDVNPYTLGVSAMEGHEAVMSVIIPRNTTIPVTRHNLYMTEYFGQRRAEIVVLQGEHRISKLNHEIGRFTIRDLPVNMTEREKIDVAFSYNLDGILQVAATVVSTGKAATVTYDLTQTGPKEYEDVSGWKTSSIAADYRATIRRGERAMKKAKELGREEFAADIKDLLYELKYEILHENQVKADEWEEELRELIDI